MKIKCCDYKDYYLKGKSVDLFFLDPPFGIGEEKFGKRYNRKNDNVIKDYYAWDKDNYEIEIKYLLSYCYRSLKDNGSIFLFCAWNNLDIILNAIKKRTLSYELKIVNHLIWHYNFGVYTKHKFVNSHYHILWIAKEGQQQYFNQFGIHSTTKESYNDLQDVLFFKKEFQHGGKKNINKLPSKLVEHLIKLTTKKGDIVCDLFAGSFVVPKVAEQLGRVGIGCEINPKCFADVNLNYSDLKDIENIFKEEYEKTEEGTDEIGLFNQVIWYILTQDWQEALKDRPFFKLWDEIILKRHPEYKCKDKIIGELKKWN